MVFHSPPIEMLQQCWLNAGPASQMVIQHSPGIPSTSRVFMSARAASLLDMLFSCILNLRELKLASH